MKTKITQITLALALGFAGSVRVAAEAVVGRQDSAPAHAFTSAPITVQPQGTFVGLENGATAVAALTGTLTVNFTDGSPSITVAAGTGLILGQDGAPLKDAKGNAVKSLADLLKWDTTGSLRSAILGEIKSVAAQVIAAKEPALRLEATTQLAALVKVMAVAAPEQAPGIVSGAVGALTQTGSSPAAENAIVAVVAAALVSPEVDRSAIIDTATKTAAANNVTVNVTAVTASTDLRSSITTNPVSLDVTATSAFR